MAIPDIFLSHSATDANIANALVRMLTKALTIKPNQIRCTSCAGHRLQIGDEADLKLRREAINSKILIGLITDASIESNYVMFELGARWGTKKKIFPLLAAGADFKSLPTLLKNTHALNCNNQNDLTDLVSKIGRVIKIRPNNESVYKQEMDEVMSISTREMDHRRNRSFLPIPLDDIVNYDLARNFARFPKGTQILTPVPFSVDRQDRFFDFARITPNNDARPLRIEPAIRNVRSVYFLINAGNAHLQFKNLVIGEIELTFEKGGVQKTQLVLGVNIREWAINNGPLDYVIQAEQLGNALITVWNDVNTAGKNSVIDRLEVPILLPFREDRLTQITFKRTTVPTVIYTVIAVTVEYTTASNPI